MKVIVLHNQTLLDISIQATGTPENALWIALQNGLVPSDEIKAGSVLEISSNLINDEDIKRYYKANNILPATGVIGLQKGEIESCEGVSCWSINSNFLIS